ncbi:MAG: LOG family protein, partial [Nocardioides sp.]
MRHIRGRVVAVDSLTDFDRRLASGARTLAGWHLRNLDLRGRSEELRIVQVGGALFLGCTLLPEDEVAARAR